MFRPRIGLALGSGIARGWGHIGVLRAMDRAGIRPDIICGTSMGAVVGAAYAAGRLAPLEAWARSLQTTSILRYLDLRLGNGGLFAGKRLKKLLEDNFHDTTIESLSCTFASVATDLATGHEVWLRHGSVVDSVMASYALPGVFSPVKVEGRWLIDGALVNPVPTSACRALGARLVIAVNLNADVFGTHRLDVPADDLAENLNTGAKRRRAGIKPGNVIMKQLFGHGENVPSLMTNMVAALNIVTDRLSRSRLAGDPPDVTIAPRLGDVGLLEFGRAEEAIAEGERAFERTRPFLENALRVLGEWPNTNNRQEAAEPVTAIVNTGIHRSASG